MNTTNLLLLIFLIDVRSEGLRASERLLASARDVKLMFFSDLQRHALSGRQAIARLSRGFNLVEGCATVSVSADPKKGPLRLNIRYRPALSSKAWTKIGFPDVNGVPLEERYELTRQFLHPLEDQHKFKLLRLFLTLAKFEHPSRLQEDKVSGVVELLCHDYPKQGTVEETIIQCLLRCCPEILRSNAWGVADEVPFRQLTIEEEWETAETVALWGAVGADGFVASVCLYDVWGLSYDTVAEVWGCPRRCHRLPFG